MSLTPLTATSWRTRGNGSCRSQVAARQLADVSGWTPKALHGSHHRWGHGVGMRA
jgi:hypothetical protein